MDTHDYLGALYDAQHDSPMQRKLRRLAPMPFGVVFLPWAGMTEEQMRGHFRTMKALGFHNLKQTMPCPGWPAERILEVALEEGVIPFWYGEGGYEDPTPELLRSLGLPADLPPEEALAHPAYLARQREALRARLHAPKFPEEEIEGTNLQEAGFQQFVGKLQLHNDPVLRPDAEPAFKAWCRQRYGQIERLVEAWNQREVGISPAPYESWGEFDADAGLARHNHREYAFLRDVLRFKADVFIERIRRRAEHRRRMFPEEPQRAGGEMGLFLPFAWRGTDMEGIAELMREHGSFYPSIHFAWHYEEVKYEGARCIYMQSSLCTDWFKGGWAATWESTGGPQMFSGGKGWNPTAAEETAGFTTDAGTMSQLLLSYLAGGFKGAGLWAWNYRRAGWEAGEYALCNRQNEPGPRAVRAGQIAAAAGRLRRELWDARKEPYVGVLVNWDCECLWAAISQPNRDHFRHYPVRARVGVSRLLIDANVPFEYVTPADLRGGLAPRYRVIVLPAQVSVGEDLQRLLLAYAEAGGRVVADAPGFWFDEKGKVLENGPGSLFERLFGAVLRDYQYCNPNQVRLWQFPDGPAPEGFVMQLEATTAAVRAAFAGGEPAQTENAVGQGSAALLAWSDSHGRFRKEGGAPWRDRALRALLGPYESPYACDGAVVYRLAAPTADHYFLLNDAPARTVFLDTKAYRYAAAEDPVTGEALPLGGPIALEAYSARWLRLRKA